MLATAYGVLAFEALLTATAKPSTLPYLRAAVFYVLHLNALDANPDVVSGTRACLLDHRLLGSTTFLNAPKLSAL